MESERWQQIEEILQAALDLPSGERTAFLIKSCAGDDELRREVESYLAREDSAEHFIETSAMKIVARGLAEADLSSQQISHYRIIKPIGEGGMGKVYLAADSTLNRNVAIKFLPEAFTADRERVRRFEQEARAASALNHPNIITIHDFGQSDGRHFIVTEYIEGQTLREKLKESPPDIPQIINIALQVTSALKAAHAANIIHRDIKPENIMLRDDGVVKVLDFGIAKLQDRETEGWRDRGNEGDLLTQSLYPSVSVSTSLTQLGVVMGTASYMSPEQARSEEVDHRTDLFSLGAVLYEMVTRQRLFEGRTQAEVLRSLASNDEPPRLESRLSDAPKELAAIIRLALKKDRNKRYASAERMLGDLQQLHDRLKTQRLRRTMKYVAIGLAAAVVILLGAFWLARGEVWEEHKMNDGHVGHVRRTVFSPDGSKLVSVGEDKQVIVWDFVSRKRLKTFTDHTDWVSSVAFSPDGNWFATGSFDQTVAVWDAKRLEQVVVLREHQGQVHSVVFSPDSRWLVTSSYKPDERTIVWKAGQWEKTQALPVGSGYGNLLFHPNERWLLSSTDYGLRVWDVLTGQRVTHLTLHSDPGWNWAALSQNASILATIAGDGDIRLFDVKKQRQIGRHHAHQDHGRSIAFSPDERLIASAAEDIVLWDAVTQTKLGRFDYPAIVWSVAFSPDGKWIVSTHADGAVLLWDVAERRRIANFNGHSQAVRAVAVSPDGQFIASAGDDASVLIWNTASGQKEAVLIGHQTRINGVVFAPTGAWPDGSQFASYDQSGTIMLWDIAHQQVKQKLVGRGGYTLTASPDGRWLATTQYLYDTNNQALRPYQIPLVGSIYGLAFSRYGSRLAGGTDQGQILLWDAQSWKLLAQQERKGEAFISVSFAPDGKQLATGDDNGNVRLWSVEPLREIAKLGRHDARVKTIAFSPDGSEVVSCGDDKRIKLWNVGQRRLIRTIGDHSSPVYAVAFSRDGKFIVSGEHDHTVRIYRRHRTWFGSKVD